MLIQEKPIKHWIDHFYGYGSWEARFWFVSYEEGGGDLPEEVAERLNYFFDAHPSAVATLCNIRQLYEHVNVRLNGRKAGLFQNMYEYRFGNQAVCHTIWKNLICFLQGYRQEEVGDALTYQKDFFASSSRRTEALLRLFPLPAPNNHGWYYSWLDLPQFPFLKSREQYEQHLYGNRIQTILHHIRVHNPELVLMYGMNNINALKRSVHDMFPDARFKMMKAVKQHVPQHHHANLGRTTLVLTTQIPALRHNRVETGFDWNAFGSLVRSST